MYEVSDESGNRFFVESKKLACRIVKEGSNPFINIFKIKGKVPKKDIVKDYDGFLKHFY